MKKVNHGRKVLILGADGTQSLPIAESLYCHGYEIHGFFGKKMSYGYTSRFFKYKCIIHPSDELEHLRLVIEYVKVNKIDVIFPMGDKVAELISKYKGKLENIVKLVAPTYSVFLKGYDKNQLMLVCKQIGIPHPKTIDLSQVQIEDVDDGIFPALIKPNITTGGRGMTLVRNKEEFKEKFHSIYAQYGNCHLQEFIEAGGRQIKVQLFVDRLGNILCSSVMHKQRYYPEKGGSSSCNTTIKDDSVVQNCLKVLQNIHWEGFADFDLIEDPKDSVLKIMEINPRVPACVKSAIKSGADYAELYVDYALKNNLNQYMPQTGITLRHLGFDVLWFVHSKDRFKAKPSWFRFFGKKLFYQDLSLSDPLPFFSGSIDNIRNFLNVSHRKQKAGLG